MSRLGSVIFSKSPITDVLADDMSMTGYITASKQAIIAALNVSIIPGE